MRACGVHTYADYQALLDARPVEYERLRDALTINVTRFYRNAETWNRLRNDLLPGALRPAEGELRAWSAGCSSGRGAVHPRRSSPTSLERDGRPDQLDRWRSTLPTSTA